MKILIYGAGVLGCNLAVNLLKTKHNITILARNEWADNLEENGLIIKSAFFPRKRKYRINIIRSLEENDYYDVIFVVLRYTQLDSIISNLNNNKSKNIVFVGNNLSCKKYEELLNEKNIMFAFYMAVGHKDDERIVSFSMKKITIGQTKEKESNQELINNIFDNSKIKARYESNMEDYLLCHASYVLPIAFACYYTDGNLKRIKRNKDYINKIIKANIEGYKAIEDSGHEILPNEDKDYNSKKFYKLCYRLYRLMFSTKIGKICVSDHSLNAVDEMSALNNELKKLFSINNSKCESYYSLENDAKKYSRN